MSILIRRVVTLALTLVTLTLLAACGPSNNVRLIYNTNTSAVLPLPGSPSVAVVMFNDERTRQYIGERKDGSVFTASSTIADWFSRSLADELGRQGVQVSFASTLEQARAAYGCRNRARPACSAPSRPRWPSPTRRVCSIPKT